MKKQQFGWRINDSQQRVYGFLRGISDFEQILKRFSGRIGDENICCFVNERRCDANDENNPLY